MYTALIHNYYTSQVAPHQAIHLSMTTGVQGDAPGVKTYVGFALAFRLSETRPELCDAARP